MQLRGRGSARATFYGPLSDGFLVVNQCPTTGNKKRKIPGCVLFYFVAAKTSVVIWVILNRMFQPI